MRKIFMFWFAASLLVAACEKEPDDNPGGDDGNDTLPHPEIIYRAVADIDGNCYDAVKIGDQVWMSENLRTTRYANGDPIPMGVESSTDPCRYAPDGDESQVPVYGYLYNWSAVMHGETSSNAVPSGVQGICPNGWHVPSDSEWTAMENSITDANLPDYIVGRGDHAGKLAGGELGTWVQCRNFGAPGYYYSDYTERNSTGFSALPAGYFLDSIVKFHERAYFWSSSILGQLPVYRRLEYNKTYVGRNSFYNAGLSVRCLRD